MLPDNLASKIAAGEVVERPASVVKELVENSIDAGAAIIRIEVEVGGKKLIRVADDGYGMNPDEALLAIERHATSKISNESDLFNVRTLGFRGEALPSIAAVSRFEMLTRAPALDEGIRIRVEGAVVRDVEPAGCAPGTVITVRDIFYNVPARKKFMRSEATELGNISEMVSRIALAYPETHFQLNHGGREVIEAPPSKDLAGRISNALGGNILGSMVEIETSDSTGIKVHGMAGLPELSRASASHMYFYVNRRPVRDRLIMHALMEAYQGLLPKRRYPVAVIFVEMNPEEVDVNVHPTKAEVKFRDSNAIYENVHNAVMAAFSRRKSRHAPLTAVPSAPITPEPEREKRVMAAITRSLEKPPPPPAEARVERKPESTVTRTITPRESLKPVTTPRPWGYFSELKVLGQLRATYIICQSPEGLLLIDQHAAHERTAFERLRKEYNHQHVRKQTLLFPETIEMGHKEAVEMERHIDIIRRLGFDIETFGARTWRVLAQPAILSSSDPKRLVMDTLDVISEHGAVALLQEHLDEVFARMACHAVVRANRNLSNEEMDALLKTLDDADYPLTCPHGRPICVHITFEELEKMFGRR